MLFIDLGIFYVEDGTKRIADNTLVALTLMIAESHTEEKDTMVKVIVNIINKNERYSFNDVIFLRRLKWNPEYIIEIC